MASRLVAFETDVGKAYLSLDAITGIVPHVPTGKAITELYHDLPKPAADPEKCDLIVGGRSITVCGTPDAVAVFISAQTTAESEGVCSCKESCSVDCRGECGCKACRLAYNDFLSEE